LLRVKNVVLDTLSDARLIVQGLGDDTFSYTLNVNETVPIEASVPINEETLALEVMDRVGPGGHYLEEEHTYNHFKDVWYSDLFDRTILQEWLAQGGKAFAERLRERTRAATEHEPAPLPEDVLAEMEEMAKHWV